MSRSVGAHTSDVQERSDNNDKFFCGVNSYVVFMLTIIQAILRHAFAFPT